jgi:hypothetical protein
MGIGRRLGEAVRAGRSAVQAQELARAGIGDLAPEPRPESLGALVVGLAANAVDEAAQAVRTIGRPQDAFRVLITDRAEIALYQLEGFVTEYLAPGQALVATAPGRDADLYLGRRLALVVEKWNLRSVLVFGPAAAALAKKARPACTGRPREVFAPGDGHLLHGRTIGGVLQ